MMNRLLCPNCQNSLSSVSQDFLRARPKFIPLPKGAAVGRCFNPRTNQGCAYLWAIRNSRVIGLYKGFCSLFMVEQKRQGIKDAQQLERETWQGYVGKQFFGKSNTWRDFLVAWEHSRNPMPKANTNQNFLFEEEA